jgi:hypothetical protein
MYMTTNETQTNEIILYDEYSIDCIPDTVVRGISSSDFSSDSFLTANGLHTQCTVIESYTDTVCDSSVTVSETSLSQRQRLDS